jgi:hypothetical protein
MPDHFRQHASRLITTSYFSQKSHSPAVNFIAGPQAKVEAQAIDGGHGSLVGGLTCKPAGDQKERIGVICIHMLDDSRRDPGEGIG